MIKCMVLDLGCGSGLTTFYLSQKYNSVVGVDLDITKAEKKFSQLNFVKASAQELPFETEKFDKVFCYDVLEHVDDLEQTLNEIFRVLKTGGQLIAEIPFWKSEKMLLKIKPNYLEQIHHQRIFKKNEFQEITANHGFRIVNVKKMRGIDNLKLALLFRRKKKILNQRGDFKAKNSFILENVYLLFKMDLFKTKLRYFFLFWIFTLPLGLLLTQIYPKTIHYELVKSEK